MKFHLLFILTFLLLELSCGFSFLKKSLNRFSTKNLLFLSSDVSNDSSSWIKSTFKGLEPCSYFKNPRSVEIDKLNERFCIINSAEELMNIPLIDFDPKEYASDIFDQSYEKPDARSKCLHAVVRGTGGGKTRSLEEIRRQLLYMEGVLPLAVTYNGLWHLSMEDWGKNIDMRLYYALSLISRMASMFYEVELSDIVEIMMKNKSGFPQLKSKDLIQSFVSHMEESLSPYNNITKFVLLIDESAKMQEHITKIFNIENDITSVVRDALLTREVLVKGEGSTSERLNVGLVISSLTLTPIGSSLSSRFVEPILLPGHLNTSRVVREIWGIVEADQEIFKKFELLAASMSELPRAIEFAMEFIKKKEKDQDIGSIQYFEKLYKNIISEIKCVYCPTNSLPVNPSKVHRLLYSIVFKEMVVVDEVILGALQNSLITNSLKSFQKKNLSFFPETSLIMLCLAIEEDFPYLHESVNKILEKMISCDESSIGFLLETIFSEWIKVKLEVARLKEVQNFTVKTLLGLKDLSDVDEDYQNFFETHMSMEDAEVETMDLEKISYKNKTNAFLEELESVKVSERVPFVILHPQKGEAFDVGLKVFMGDEKPLYLFFDLKSKEELKPVKNTFIITDEVDLPKNGSQYLHMKREMSKTDLEFIFVYVSTDNIKSDLVESCKNLCVFGRDETLGFLGPVSNFYIAARSMLN